MQTGPSAHAYSSPHIPAAPHHESTEQSRHQQVIDCGGPHGGPSASKVRSVAPARLDQAEKAAGGPWGSTNVYKQCEGCLKVRWRRSCVGGCERDARTQARVSALGDRQTDLQQELLRRSTAIVLVQLFRVSAKPRSATRIKVCRTVRDLVPSSAPFESVPPYVCRTTFNILLQTSVRRFWTALSRPARWTDGAEACG